MQNPNIVFIGMDTHKEFTDVAYIYEGFDQKPQHLGEFSSRKQSMTKMVRQFQSKHPKATLYFVYEAGPYGYWLYRLFKNLGQEYFVVVRLMKVSNIQSNMARKCVVTTDSKRTLQAALDLLIEAIYG